MTFRRGVHLGGGGANVGAPFSNTVPGESNWATDGFLWELSDRVDTIRLSMRWERMQPELGGVLNSDELGEVQRILRTCAEAGIEVILDLHNHANYYTDGHVENRIDGGVVTANHLADFWVRMSNAVGPNTSYSVLAYGLMHEPDSMPTGAAGWEAACQHVMQTLRNHGDYKLVLIPGYGSSRAANWATHHPDPWIVRTGQAATYPDAYADPVDHFIYEAHEHLDGDGHGTFAAAYDDLWPLHTIVDNTYDRQTDHYISVQLAPFTSFLTTHDQRGYIGNWGIKSSSGTADATETAKWNAYGAWVRDYLATNDIWSTVWLTDQYTDSLPAGDASGHISLVHGVIPEPTPEPEPEPPAPTGDYLVSHATPFLSTSELNQMRIWVDNGRYVTNGVGHPTISGGSISNGFRGTYNEMVSNGANLNVTETHAITNYTSDGKVATGETTAAQENDPTNDHSPGNVVQNNIRALHEAFVGLIENNNTKKARASRWVYNSARVSSMQMHLSSWENPTGNIRFPDANPMFGTANYISLMVRVLSYTNGYGLSSSEMDTVNLFLARAAARYIKETQEYYVHTLGSGRLSGDYKTSGLTANNNMKLYDNGPENWSLNRRWQNRAANSHRMWMMIGEWFDWIGYDPSGVTVSGQSYSIADYQHHAKLWVKEFLMFGLYPQGAGGDQHRSSSAKPMSGMTYTMTNIIQPMLVAEMFARKGDFELLNYRTTTGNDRGNLSTAATPSGRGTHGAIVGDFNGALNGQGKSLRWAARMAAHYGSQHYNRTYDGQSLNWRRATASGKYMGTESLWWWSLNRYWNDSYLTGVMERTQSNTPYFPANAEQGFRRSVFNGDGHTFASVLFEVYGHTSNPFTTG